MATKGDHNGGQLIPINNQFSTDETNISKNQVLGVAVARIPYLGWVKLFFFGHTLVSFIILAGLIIFYLVVSGRKDLKS
jgi:hypothetical protein